MLNFPLPYPDELVYSVVARAGVHMGITSPKQLLDEVYLSRLVIATVDLPSHLNRLLRLYPKQSGCSVEQLVYEHTLFPLYAPFTSVDRRKQCLEKMAGDTYGSIHLILGVAASRLKQPKYLRYCPKCLQRQLVNHGEYYWKRQWQIMGADCCLEHGKLLEASIYRHDYHRHQFFPASPNICPVLSQQPASPATIRVAKQVERLLHLHSYRTATFAQWTIFYQELAKKAGCLSGRHVRHEDVLERVLTHWSDSWLDKYGLAIQEAESTWLRAIFRKHRKAFSYLEHIVVLDSILPRGWRIDEVLSEVRSIKNIIKLGSTALSIFDNKPTRLCEINRGQWLAAIEKNKKIKQARINNSALYAWLYRYDKKWLLSVNAQLKKQPIYENRRVDWHKRDLNICRQLIRTNKEYKFLLDSPRLSKNWYLSKLDHRATVEKNLGKLPLTASFFERYCESINDYQIRRLKRVLSSSAVDRHIAKHWFVLRMSGLSKERITPKALTYLNSQLES